MVCERVIQVRTGGDEYGERGAVWLGLLSALLAHRYSLSCTLRVSHYHLPGNTHIDSVSEAADIAFRLSGCTGSGNGIQTSARAYRRKMTECAPTLPCEWL